ncbi:MAG: hypothetical protein WD716_08850 [Fimbriimonadaceae bacterium]
MPSKRRRKTKKRKKSTKLWTKKADLTPLFWALLAVVVATGLAYSPATSVKSVRIVGAASFDRARLDEVVQTLRARPYLRVDTDRIQSLVLEGRDVGDARFQGNLFGRGVLEVTYRRPVAALADSPGRYLSSDGTVYRSSVQPSLAIEVEPPADQGLRNLSVFGSWRSGLAAKMCENVIEQLPDWQWRMVVSRAGFVSLVPESGGTVEFGSFDGAETKVLKLGELLKDEPGLLARVKVVQLSSPESPTYVPR